MVSALVVERLPLASCENARMVFGPGCNVRLADQLVQPPGVSASSQSELLSEYHTPARLRELSPAVPRTCATKLLKRAPEAGAVKASVGLVVSGVTIRAAAVLMMSQASL